MPNQTTLFALIVVVALIKIGKNDFPTLKTASVSGSSIEYKVYK